MRLDRSTELYAEAQRYLPGGVNSPARAFGAVGGGPLFIERGSGCRLTDADGNVLIDLVCSWGPLILGHAHPGLVRALQEAVTRGTSYGAPTEIETCLARQVCEAVPSIEMVRMVNSGTEATMSAVRLARGVTGRPKLVKFEGCWHGHGDAFLIKAGSSALTTGAPDSPGVPAGTAADTLLARYNDLQSVRSVFEGSPDQIAAVIVEPVAGNMGVVPPAAGFLDGLRTLTREAGALLIFDEVITGFRVGYGGAQGLWGLEPDLTCLGKIIGGGLPVGAYGGRRELMENVSPLGMRVSQAGTLSGNPLAMTAGCETLVRLAETGTYQRLEALAARLEAGLREAAGRAGVPVCVNRVGSMLTLFFTGGPVADFAGATASDTERFARFHRAMLEEGVYLPCSQFEAIFVSLAHEEGDIDAVCEAAARALARIGRS
jgi:glutamate-1-semialdehyde 2,1-aminomutase